jgi:DNA primase
MSVIDEIKSQIDAVSLISETVQLRKTGKNYTGFCPFHPNSRTPAFVVFPDSGTWRCFGQCNQGGDIFQFIMKKEGWDFSEALRYLADRAGIQLKPQTPEQKQAADVHEQHRELLESAVVFYRHNLLNTPGGLEVLDYLHTKRYLNDQTLEAFGVGYAPQSWDATNQHFLQKGVKVEDLVAVGLVSERDEGGIYDRFRHRIMIPIRDYRGRMSGFGARIVDPDDVPKFLNSPQTALFDKSQTLYGFDRARQVIREKDQAVIVEGYLDVISLHQAGFANVISPMGTALTEQQLKQVKRYTRNIILALDPDAAGDQATLRGLQIARQAMDREEEPVFDARGLLGHEARLQADIRVATLPDNLDPDEVVQRDPAEWQKIIDNARPIIIHVMEALAAGKDLEDPKIKDEIAAQVLPLIQDVPGAIQREAYRQRLARLLKVHERTLLDPRATTQRSRTPVRRQRASIPNPALPPKSTIISTHDSSYALEVHCLGILMRAPSLLYQVDRTLQENKLSRLTVDDFQHTDHQNIFRLVQKSTEQALAEPLNFIMNSLSLELMDLADDLLVRTGNLDPQKDKVLEDLLRSVLILRRRNLQQSIEYIRILMVDAQENGDTKAAPYLKTLQQHTEALRGINEALGKLTGDQRLYGKQDNDRRYLPR